MGDVFTMTIDGRGVSSTNTMPILNPATEQMVALAPNASDADLNTAVEAASAAFTSWSKLPLEQRGAYVDAMGQALLDKAEMLAPILTKEQGKPLTASQREIARSGDWAKAVATLDVPVEVIERPGLPRTETHFLPIGVVAAVVPWNFPILLAMQKLAPALLAGNTVILKPSPFTPLTTLKIGEILRDVLPAGVMNVISGDDSLGPRLSSHAGIAKISFTGSTATGKRVMAAAAQDLKRVTLELGGNDPSIVMADVDVDGLAEKLFWSAFTNSGQVCIASKRMYVHDAVYDRLRDALVAIAKKVKVGDGMEDGVAIGPIQNRPQFERVKELIADAKAKGHTFALGGEVPDGRGYFVPISIVDNPPEDSRVVREEAFGPVLPLLRFSEIEDVVARANNTEYGLGATVWCADDDQAADIASRLNAGTVWVNELQGISPFAAFAGHRHSGLGMANGVHGLLEFTVAKTFFGAKATPAAIAG